MCASTSRQALFTETCRGVVRCEWVGGLRYSAISTVVRVSVTVSLGASEMACTALSCAGMPQPRLAEMRCMNYVLCPWESRFPEL